VVSGSDNYIIKLCDIKSGKEIRTFASFDDQEWLSKNDKDEYVCSDGAYKHFHFQDTSGGIPKVLDKNHPIYKEKNKNDLHVSIDEISHKDII